MARTALLPDRADSPAATAKLLRPHIFHNRFSCGFGPLVGRRRSTSEKRVRVSQPAPTLRAAISRPTLLSTQATRSNSPFGYLTPERPSSSRVAARFSAELELTLHRARTYANERKHEYTTLEHLLLALIDDVNASGVMRVCDVDVDALKESLGSYIDNDLKPLVIDDGHKSKLTAAFKRVVRRAVLHAHGLGREMATGGHVLVALFDEKESPAVWFLGEQE